MKKVFAVLASLALLSGCCSAGNGYTKTEFDGSSTEQTLAFKYNNHYFVNMTDGIFVCSSDFEKAEQLTNEYCFDPYIYENKLYYVGQDENFTGEILKSLDLSSEEVEILYEFTEYNGYRHVDDMWYLIDGNKIVKIREEDGTTLSETVVKDMDMAFVEFINDEFLIYNSMCESGLTLVDLNTKSSSKVFSIEEGRIGATVMCDGESVYYALINPDESVDFCKYNMSTENHETLIKGGFGEEFNIYDDVCYFYSYTRGDFDGYIKAFNMNNGAVNVLLTTQYPVEDINILDNKLFYRVTDYGKQIEVLNLEDNSTTYLYEKYADITERVP